MDLDQTVLTLKVKIGEIVGVTDLLDYGIYLDDSSAEPVLLDDSKKLNSYKIKEGV